MAGGSATPGGGPAPPALHPIGYSARPSAASEPMGGGTARAAAERGRGGRGGRSGRGAAPAPWRPRPRPRGRPRRSAASPTTRTARKRGGRRGAGGTAAGPGRAGRGRSGPAARSGTGPHRDGPAEAPASPRTHGPGWGCSSLAERPRPRRLSVSSPAAPGETERWPPFASLARSPGSAWRRAGQRRSRGFVCRALCGHWGGGGVAQGHQHPPEAPGEQPCQSTARARDKLQPRSSHP